MKLEFVAGFGPIVRDAREEPWGHTTARLQSPEGRLVGISHTPWMHTASQHHDE